MCETASELLDQTVDPLTALLGTLAMLQESMPHEHAGLQQCLALTRRIRRAIEAHALHGEEPTRILRLDPRPALRQPGAVRQVPTSQVVEGVDA